MSIVTKQVHTQVVNTSISQRFSDKIDIRYINGKLFICEIGEDGQPQGGAQLTVDEFSKEDMQSIYGPDGDPTNHVITGVLGIEVEWEALTDNEKFQINESLKEALREDDDISFGALADIAITEIIGTGKQIGTVDTTANSITSIKITAQRSTRDLWMEKYENWKVESQRPDDQLTEETYINEKKEAGEPVGEKPAEGRGQYDGVSGIKRDFAVEVFSQVEHDLANREFTERRVQLQFEGGSVFTKYDGIKRVYLSGSNKSFVFTTNEIHKTSLSDDAGETFTPSNANYYNITFS